MAQRGSKAKQTTIVPEKSTQRKEKQKTKNTLGIRWNFPTHELHSMWIKYNYYFHDIGKEIQTRKNNQKLM